MLEPHAQRRPPPMDASNVYAHSRTRTTSSNIFPSNAPGSAPGGYPQQPQQQQYQQQFQTRRSPSVGTFSTTSTAPPPNYRTSPNEGELRRSGSARSGGGTSIAPQTNGYVALLRKQKATVWSDRSQYEDPRSLAAQRAAKMRAAMEVAGGQRSSSGGLAPPSGRTTTGISATGKVAAKIRHHGKPGVVGYAPGENHVGVGGVPMRLSATEVEAESSEDDDAAAAQLKSQHRRTGSSGRSSQASRRGMTYRTSGGGAKWSPGHTPERTGSIVEEPGEPQRPASETGSTKAKSFASGSSAEKADAVGELGGLGGASSTPAARLASNSLMNSAITREKSVKTAEDLKRRGSVDDRSTSLTKNGRLFIANPD